MPSRLSLVPITLLFGALCPLLMSLLSYFVIFCSCSLCLSCRSLCFLLLNYLFFYLLHSSLIFYFPLLQFIFFSRLVFHCDLIFTSCLCVFRFLAGDVGIRPFFLLFYAMLLTPSFVFFSFLWLSFRFFLSMEIFVLWCYWDLCLGLFQWLSLIVSLLGRFFIKRCFRLSDSRLAYITGVSSRGVFSNISCHI